MEELQWGTKTAVNYVKQIGRKKGDMKTASGNTYAVYQYGKYLVQIHVDDDEMVLVMQGGEIVWMNPRDEERLQRAFNVMGQQKPRTRKAK